MPSSPRPLPDLEVAWRFDAIGTSWQVDSRSPIPAGVRDGISARAWRFDRDWSRFRDDSLVSRIAREPGVYELPAEAGPLLALYRELYAATRGAMSPLVGGALEALGYDRDYTLRPSGRGTTVPAWDDAIAWDGRSLTALRPVVLDIGAAGKGLLVDLVLGLLADAGIGDAVVDGSGDLRHCGAGSLRVALEHPTDPRLAVGIAELSNRALCASATNRRAWGDGLHHVVDATTGLPTRRVLATWAIAETAMLADGLATALFFADPTDLAHVADFDFVRIFTDGRLERSPDFPGEVFS